jgi:type I restriction enzyme S subunit
MALRPHSLEKFNPYYLGYVLRSPKIREAIMKEGQGISRINLAASRIENIPIPVPSVAVQFKIADYLKKWDDKISTSEKTLSGLLSLKKAFLQSLFI